MALATGREWRAIPSRPSCAALKAGQLGHEVKLGWPSIAHKMRGYLCTAFGDHDALEGDGLGDGIVNRDFEPGGVDPGPRALHALSVLEAGEVGHHRLHDKHASGVQVPVGFLERHTNDSY